MNIKDLTEEKISSQEIYDGHILHITCDTVRLPNGKTATREVAWHKGAVAIVPLLEDGSVLMERQFRYPLNRVVLEIPAGKLDTADEDHLEAAKRELREETGAVAERYTDLGIMAPSVAILSEKLHIFLAEGLTFGETSPDDDEFLTVEPIKLSVLIDMIMSGEIQDSKTQVAIMKTYLLLQKRAEK